MSRTWPRDMFLVRTHRCDETLGCRVQFLDVSSHFLATVAQVSKSPPCSYCLFPSWLISILWEVL